MLAINHALLVMDLLRVDSEAAGSKVAAKMAPALPVAIAEVASASLPRQQLLVAGNVAAAAAPAIRAQTKEASFAELLDETTTRTKKSRDNFIPNALTLAAVATPVAVQLPTKLSAPALALLLGGQAIEADKPQAKAGAIVLPAGMEALKTSTSLEAPTAVSAPAWVSRVMTEASVQSHQGGGTAHLQVEIPQLGTCDFRVTVRGESVQVHLNVPASSNQPLQPQLSAMSAGLRSLGLQVTEVVVSISETTASDEDAPQKDQPDPQENES